jgi:hypothetical protein
MIKPYGSSELPEAGYREYSSVYAPILIVRHPKPQTITSHQLEPWVQVLKSRRSATPSGATSLKSSLARGRWVGEKERTVCKRSSGPVEIVDNTGSQERTKEELERSHRCSLIKLNTKINDIIVVFLICYFF